MTNKEKVRQKAERLLRRMLPPREYCRYKIYGHVWVKGSKGGLYKLTKSKAYNVHQLKPKKRVMCAVPADVSQLGYADIIVTQYLALINDEKKFVKTANIQGETASGAFFNEAAGIQPELWSQALMGGLAGRVLGGMAAQREQSAIEMATGRQAAFENLRIRLQDQMVTAIEVEDGPGGISQPPTPIDRNAAGKLTQESRFRDFARTLAGCGITGQDLDYVMEHLLRHEEEDDDRFAVQMEIRDDPASSRKMVIFRDNRGGGHSVALQNDDLSMQDFRTNGLINFT